MSVCGKCMYRRGSEGRTDRYSLLRTIHYHPVFPFADPIYECDLHDEVVIKKSAASTAFSTMLALAVSSFSSGTLKPRRVVCTDI